MKTTQSVVTLCLAFFLICTLFGCTKKEPYYGVTISNYTNQGIVFYDTPFKSISSKKKLLEVRRYPGIPGSKNGIWNAGQFIGNKSKLADDITIKWQIFELRNCEYEGGSKAKKSYKYKDYDESDPNIYFVKRGCDWHPIPNKLFETTLDLRPFQQSEAFQKLGQKTENGERYTASMMLAFYGENDIRITTKSGQTNWMAGFAQ